jgi:hypothetical protein
MRTGRANVDFDDCGTGILFSGLKTGQGAQARAPRLSHSSHASHRSHRRLAQPKSTQGIVR